jgi:hypothetical protein
MVAHSCKDPSVVRILNTYPVLVEHRSAVKNLVRQVQAALDNPSKLTFAVYVGLSLLLSIYGSGYSMENG